MINRQQGAPRSGRCRRGPLPSHCWRPGPSPAFPGSRETTKGPSPPPGKTAPERSPCPPGTEGAAALPCGSDSRRHRCSSWTTAGSGGWTCDSWDRSSPARWRPLDQRRRAASLFQLIFWFVNKIQKGQRCHLPSIKVKSYCPVINRGVADQLQLLGNVGFNALHHQLTQRPLSSFAASSRVPA